MYGKIIHSILDFMEGEYGRKSREKTHNLEDTFSITMELQRPLLKDEDDEMKK